MYNAFYQQSTSDTINMFLSVIWNDAFLLLIIIYNEYHKMKNQTISAQGATIFHEIVNHFNTLRPRQHGHHFPDDNFKFIPVNENARISIKFILNIVLDGPINNSSALV